MAGFAVANERPSMYEFRYAPGSRHKVSADVVGRVCSELDADDRLTPENLVDVSRPEDAPVHDEFEWDDEVAAEKYRVTQAGALIRHVILVEKPKDDDNEQRQFVITDGRDWNGCRAFGSLHVQGGKKERYVSTAKMMDDDQMREILIGNAKNELVAFTRKYSKLSAIAEFKTLFEEIRKVTG